MNVCKRREFVKTLAAGAVAVGSWRSVLSADRKPTGTRPNILYIFTDDQSIRSVSCYPEAHKWVRTPNIDRLAKEGVRFEYCYTGAWCMPARATALTGKLPHGIESMRMTGKYPGSTYDPKQCPFWPATFRKNGYYTGMIGKWHTGKDTGHGRDWDYSAVWDHTQPRTYGGYYKNQKISFNGAKPKAVAGYSTDNYTKYAVDFIKQRAAEPDKPWYLWLCYDAVHSPYKSAGRHGDDYKDAPEVTVPKDVYPPRPTKPGYMKNYGVWKRNAAGRPAKGRMSLDQAVRQYNRAVRALDEGVGKVLDALKVAGQLDNTLVVFTSDQGFAWGQHGFAWKYAPYDANLRAPLIVRMSGSVAAGKVCRHAVGGQDLIPTFFSIAGIEPPWKMHGRDISGLLKNPDTEWDHPVLIENTKYYYGKDTDREDRPGWSGVPWWVFIRQGKYKYIRTLVKGEIEELYDLQADPEELTNLAIDPKYQSMLADYRKRLVAELKRTDAAMADSLPKVGLRVSGKDR
jgi:arylsulfatase A-like enzyme